MRKKIYILLPAFTMCFQMFAQKITEENVPVMVSDAFKVKFTTAEKVQWEMDYDKYEAYFKMNKIDVSAKFDKDGKWLETETPVNHSNLPPNVKNCLTKQFDIFKENEIEKVEKPEGTIYDFKITSNGLEYEVVVDEKGELISKNQVREYKKDY